MTGPRRHLRLVAIGDDVDPPPPPPRRWTSRDVDLYERRFADLCRQGWHPAAAAVEAGAAVERARKGRT